ncbi:hypothetical protein GXW83_33210 [Streptacidiphilus sp. PB12-B1b]|uniref:hypothetical protein n=1 Tax=Streptacidiphilus sp. PB12-B1b TaxID=2705012 RepID=UPI0015FB0311|nr:hypothetical protein [Streptacidiphilus sp. PB12-B1b]QMU79839.1 hypothetical protein GXW83_33210 [Streptacidiphilus sp. PB12-B1b]
MNNEKRMTLWCRMWDEDPSLAHDLMTDTCVQWSDRLTSLDSAVGAQEQERCAARYRVERANAFTPRVLADGGDRFAYLWDVRAPDGTVRSGMDVNVLRGDLVDENWTFVAERRCERPDSAAEGFGPADPTLIEDLLHRWLRLRNGEASSAGDLVTGDFTLFSGAGPDGDAAGPDGLAGLASRWSGGAVAVHRSPVVDPARGRVAFLWTSTGPDGDVVGGADLLTVRDGRLAQGWSMTGIRPFRY